MEPEQEVVEAPRHPQQPHRGDGVYEQWFDFVGYVVG